MSNKVALNIRVDEEVKDKAEEILSEIGIPLATAMNVFLRKLVYCGGFPFDLKIDVPNLETIEAMKEGDSIIKSGKSRFNNSEEMFKDLGI